MRRKHFDDAYSTEAQYNTKAVARKTGVPADTVRAWERRYGVPLPHRAETGQRLYSERDIALIRWLRDRTAEGLTISRAVRLLETDVVAASEDDLDPAAWERLQQRLVDALLRLDASAAEAILGQAFARYALDDVCLQLIEPALVQIGSGWHTGTVSIGQEHFATGLLRRKLQALLSVYDVVSGQATIIAACAPGEHHEVGLLILALALVRRGYRVVYLGANVPIEGLLPVVEQVRPDMVCLSATTAATAEEVGPMADAIRRLYPGGTLEGMRPPLVVAGGQGIAASTGPGGSYEPLTGDAIEATKQIGRLLARQGGAEARHGDSSGTT